MLPDLPDSARDYVRHLRWTKDRTGPGSSGGLYTLSLILPGLKVGRTARDHFAALPAASPRESMAIKIWNFELRLSRLKLAARASYLAKHCPSACYHFVEDPTRRALDRLVKNNPGEFGISN